MGLLAMPSFEPSTGRVILLLVFTGPNSLERLRLADPAVLAGENIGRVLEGRLAGLSSIPMRNVTVIIGYEEDEADFVRFVAENHKNPQSIFDRIRRGAVFHPEDGPSIDLTPMLRLDPKDGVN